MNIRFDILRGTGLAFVLGASLLACESQEGDAINVNNDDRAGMANTPNVDAMPPQPTPDSNAGMPVMHDMINLHKKELVFANVATEKATNDEVKGYARMLIEHHTQGLNEVQQAMTNAGMGGNTPGQAPGAQGDMAGVHDGAHPGGAMPPEGSAGTQPAAGTPGGTPTGMAGTAAGNMDESALDAPARQALEQLRGLSADAFDREFINLMVMEHEKGISMLRSAQASNTGTPVGELIDKQLPTLETHLEQARQLSQKLGSTAAAPQ